MSRVAVNLLPDRIPTQIRRLTSGAGPVVVRGIVDHGDIRFWVDGLGRTVDEARQRCERLALLLVSDFERYR